MSVLDQVLSEMKNETERIQNLLRSYPERIQAVISAKEGHTHF